MSEDLNSFHGADLEEICERYAGIYTGAISDVLDEMGYPNQTLPAGIQGLTLDHHLAGVAMPAEGGPHQGSGRDEFYIPTLQMLGDLRPGDVIVLQANDSVSAHLGELSCETAKHRGARGVVIDGGCRDIDYILKLGFPVFCRYRTQRDSLGRWKLSQYGQPVRIGGVTVQRGDFVAGDKDGVLVIPQKIALEVLQRAEEVVSTENEVRKAILQGAHPVEAYRKFGRF